MSEAARAKNAKFQAYAEAQNIHRRTDSNSYSTPYSPVASPTSPAWVPPPPTSVEPQQQHWAAGPSSPPPWSPSTAFSPGMYEKKDQQEQGWATAAASNGAFPKPATPAEPERQQPDQRSSVYDQGGLDLSQPLVDLSLANTAPLNVKRVHPTDPSPPITTPPPDPFEDSDSDPDDSPEFRAPSSPRSLSPPPTPQIVISAPAPALPQSIVLPPPPQRDPVNLLSYKPPSKFMIPPKPGGWEAASGQPGGPARRRSMLGKEKEVKVKHGSQKHLSVLQWNVWFDGLFSEQRSRLVIDHIFMLSPLPSVICLQEVTPIMFFLLKEDARVQSSYSITDYSESVRATKAHYGCLVMVRKDVEAGACAFEVEDGSGGMESDQGRKLVGVDLPTADVRVVSGHFESPVPGYPSTSTRTRQFQLAASLSTPFFLSPTSSSPSPPAPSLTLVCGDLNILSEDELGAAFDAQHWTDAYPSLHPPTDPGFTFGTTYPSPFGKAQPPPVHAESGPRRLDRLLLCSTTSKVRGGKTWEAVECSLVGDLTFLGGSQEDPRGRDGKVWASDHLGVHTSLARV